MNGRDFEWFAKYFFENFGYQRTHITEKHGELQGDGGVDVIMYKDLEKIYVQCKRWSRGFHDIFLPLAVIRELGGCMLRDNVKKGMVFTTLMLDEHGKREAGLMNIELYGLREIVEKMKSINPDFDVQIQRNFLQLLLHWIGRVLRFFVSILSG
jgi:restriction endonuclease Mrr